MTTSGGMAAAAQRLVRLSRRFLREKRGATLPMMAAAILPLIGSLGTGIDLGRIYMARSQMQAGVDAAALAGARSFAVDDNSPADRDRQVEAYFENNFPTGYLGSTNLSLNPAGATPRFQVLNQINVTTVTAEAVLPMAFMQVLGAQPRTIRVSARAEVQPRPLEVMVVLDNTGSLKANLPADADGVVKTRITALKQAATSFINTLFQGAESRPELALGFVTYDVTVNVGKALIEAGGAVEQLQGFNDSGTAAWPTNRLGWKGCVMSDATKRDISADLDVSDPGAWDIVRSLPGEGSHPAVTPFYIPPQWVPAVAKKVTKNGTTTDNTSIATSDYYKPLGTEPSNNLFQFDGTNWTSEKARNLANSAMYRQFFYDWFVGLNNSGETSAEDDVIVRASDDGYFNPGAGGDWKVRYDRIPAKLKAYFAAPTEYKINKDGGKTANCCETPIPTPNWQCPEEAMTVKYGRMKSDYTSYIADKNAAIHKANGTLHHSGLLWGYRMLVRDDKFLRSNPTNDKAKRALVFMTDGETALGSDGNHPERTFTWYGSFTGKKISATDSKWKQQSERRFSKVCAAMKREVNPPDIYIVSLATTDADTLKMFDTCAPGRVYKTADTKSLRAAFDQIALELVDLHLTR